MRTLKESSLDSRDQQLLQHVREIVRRHVPEAKVILYGSVARGGQGPESDYDIHVLTAEEIPLSLEDEIRRSVWEFEVNAAVVISLMLSSRTDWENHPLKTPHREIHRDGILV